MNAELQRKIILILLIGSFGTVAWAQGFALPGIGYVTATSACLLFGGLLVAAFRIDSGRAVATKSFFEMPVVIATMLYFVIGVSTYSFAADKFLFYKEIVQRSLIIIFPLYVFSMGPKKVNDLRIVILSLLVIGVPVALISFVEAYMCHFTKPVYAFGMHKNQIAGTCAVMAVTAIAYLLTSTSKRKRFIFFDILLISLAGCVGTQGRAGLLCTIVATIFMLIAIRARPKYILRFVIGVAVGALVLTQFLPKETVDKAFSTKKFSSNEIRVALWTDIYPLLIKEPLRAVGWGNPRIEGAYYYGDVANVVLYDWMQMGILGAIVLVVLIFSAILLPIQNAWRMPANSLLSFVNLVALGIICVRFTHGMLDTFWIGRGINLITWMAIGITIWVKLLLDQNGARTNLPPSTQEPRSAIGTQRGKQPAHR